MIYTDLIKKAMILSYEAHRGQYDKGGLPYIFHPFHLAEQMSTEETVVIALLHDVIEDTEYTIQDIADMGFPQVVLDALMCLTHAPVFQPLLRDLCTQTSDHCALQTHTGQRYPLHTCGE